MTFGEYLCALAKQNEGIDGLLKFLKLSRMRFFAMKRSMVFQVEYPTSSPSSWVVKLLPVMEKYTARGFQWSAFFTINSIKIRIMWRRAPNGKAVELETTATNAILSETFVTEDELIEIALCGVHEICFQPVEFLYEDNESDYFKQISHFWKEKGLSINHYSISYYMSWGINDDS